MTNQEIANAIKWHRENIEIKSKDVANHLNLSKSAYSKLENGERTIAAVELYNISKFFNLKLDEIINIPSRRNV